MSAEPQSSGSSATTAGVAPGHNRKSSTSPPKGTQQDASVELKNMKSERDGARGSIPLGEDIMQIARIGEVPAMQRIFEEKKLTARYKDEEGITPLHVRTCRFSKERERERERESCVALFLLGVLGSLLTDWLFSFFFLTIVGCD